MSDPPDDGAPGEITRLLGAASHGHKEAFDRLLPLVYRELSALASQRLRAERVGHTLDTTALVPEGARIVQFRFFGGLSNDDVADMLGTSERTVRRVWMVAKAWLRRELTSTLGRAPAALGPRERSNGVEPGHGSGALVADRSALLRGARAPRGRARLVSGDSVRR